ncbi:MAG TPA: helix-turn-helix transcriptional regulator [Pseudonocardiaceae bacterium]|nr:helix-turn-helix transcriptional regulator [Pseudonocardiaceae bacterium]
MTAPEGSTVMRRQLGDELRRLRLAAGLKPEQVAERLDCARSKISHIENGRYGVRRPDLESLLRLYGAEHRLDELDAIRRGGTQPRWWARYDLPTWLDDLIGFEQSAKRVRVVELELIPALLQTRAYAEEMHILGPLSLSRSDLDRKVELRIERQKRLTSPDLLELSAVISEGALLRAAADTSVGAEQLRRLVTDLALPNVSVRVLPHKSGLHAVSGSFTLLDFAPDVPLKIAYEESAVGGRLVDDEEVVRALSDLHGRLRSQALDDAESLALITRLFQQTR